MTDGMLDLDLSASGTLPELHPLLQRRGLKRRHVHEHIDFTSQPSATVVMSNGCGVDSAAILFRWLTDPLTRDFGLDELLVITACTGDEYDSTVAAVDTHLIPALAAAGVRFLQVARGGQVVSDGYDVLADSFTPTHLVRRGAWHLGEEMENALTVPQVVDGRRECTYRAKGEVLDAAIADELVAGRIAPVFRHVIGYSAEEISRVEKDTSYTTNSRNPWYPLLDWDWHRQRCEQFLHELLRSDSDPDFRWPPSRCKFCCYQCSPSARVDLALRWREEPDAALVSLRMERRAMALNPRQKLFGNYSAAEFIRDYGLTDVVEAAEARSEVAESGFTVVEVRRIYRPGSVKDPVTGKSVRGRDGRTVKDPTKKGRAWRSVRPHTVTDTFTAAVAVLERLAHEHSVADIAAVAYLEIRPMPKKVTEWPVTTHAFAVVPGTVVAKERDAFDKEWLAAQAQEAARYGDVLVLTMSSSAT